MTPTNYKVLGGIGRWMGAIKLNFFSCLKKKKGSRKLLTLAFCLRMWKTYPSLVIWWKNIFKPIIRFLFPSLVAWHQLSSRRILAGFGNRHRTGPFFERRQQIHMHSSEKNSIYSHANISFYIQLLAIKIKKLFCFLFLKKKKRTSVCVFNTYLFWNSGDMQFNSGYADNRRDFEDSSIFFNTSLVNYTNYGTFSTDYIFKPQYWLYFRNRFCLTLNLSSELQKILQKRPVCLL